MDKQQVMSLSPPETSPAAPLGALGPNEVDETTSDSADISQTRERETSEHGANLLDRLEGLIGNLMRDLARERVERAQLPSADQDTRMGSGSSVFSRFLAAERNSNRADSLSEAMGMQMPFGLPQPQAQHQQQFFPTVQPTAQAYAQPRQNFHPPQDFGIKMPTVKDMKLSIERFTGKEEYKGLGDGFKDWGLQFLDELGAAQRLSGGEWSEEYKMRTLNRYLDGIARKHFNKTKGVWESEVPTVEHLMNKMPEVYDREVTVDQATRFMRARKQSDRSWTEQYQYLVTVASSASCPDRFVLQYICEGATSELKRAMHTRLDRCRTDYLKQAWELAEFASTLEQDVSAHVVSEGRHSTFGRSKARGGNIASDAIVPGNGRRYWGCNQLGHTKRECTRKNGGKQASFALSIGTALHSSKQMWILDSGASRHLVIDASLLVDAVDCFDECNVADGQAIKVTKVGQVTLQSSVDEVTHKVTLSDVYYAKDLTHNLLSYCKLEEKRVALSSKRVAAT